LESNNKKFFFYFYNKMAKEKEEVAKTRMGKLDTHLSSLWVIAALFIAVFVTICIYVYAGEQKDLPQRHFGDVEINGELSGPGQLFTRKADTHVQLHDKGTTGTCWVLTQPANTTLTDVYIQTFSTGLSTNTGSVELDITTTEGDTVLSGTSFLAAGQKIGHNTAVRYMVNVDFAGLRSLQPVGDNDHDLGTASVRKLYVNITNKDGVLGGSSPRIGVAGQFFQAY